jgi:thiamine biosynthesis protein ThiI
MHREAKNHMYCAVFSEVTLKGRNRKDFEKALERNVRAALGCQTTMRGGRLLVHTDDPEAAAKIKKIFGIDSFSRCLSMPPDIEEMRKAVATRSFTGKSIKVATRRSDKGFPLSSQRVNEIVGKDLVDRGSTVDLTHPDHTVYIDILEDRALVAFERTRCYGGLPVGSSGRVMALLSGGIDSPVAAWLMMKRGAMVDLFHMHNLPANRDVRESKIARIIKILKEYHPPRMRLFIAPYVEFFDRFLSLETRSELVVFRRFLLMLANRLAADHGHAALVTGDSLAQVASQTLENLATTDEASGLPVFRPLIGFNKQEIIDLSREIGLYDISIEPYQDCCSLVAHQNPSTRVKLEEAKRVEEKLKVGDLIEKTLGAVEVVDVI